MTASDAKPARLRFVGFTDLRRSEVAECVLKRIREATGQPPDHDAEVRIQSICRAMMEDRV